MTLTYAFNGDADGLCSLQQLRLADRRECLLLTGVKRDIKLLQRVSASAGDEVVALDISHAANDADVVRLLDAGATVRYFDHHHCGELPRHPRFEPHIDQAADVCTSVLVDRQLGGLHRAWAAVGAFGDNLPAVGHAVCDVANIEDGARGVLAELGKRLNYNAYGNDVADLCFDPADLARQMLPFANPLDFVHSSGAFARLGEQFEADMKEAKSLAPALELPGATMFTLPDAVWARRVMGVLANELAMDRPHSAIAILTPARGGFRVSVRVPAGSPLAADEFCRSFESGNGRRLAAGINHLPATDVARFGERFASRFGTR